MARVRKRHNGNLLSKEAASTGRMWRVDCRNAISLLSLRLSQIATAVTVKLHLSAVFDGRF